MLQGSLLISVRGYRLRIILNLLDFCHSVGFASTYYAFMVQNYGLHELVKVGLR